MDIMCALKMQKAQGHGCNVFFKDATEEGHIRDRICVFSVQF